jgi:O-antigen/teichoic acid export membrane protein
MGHRYSTTDPPVPERSESDSEVLGMARGGGLNLAGSLFSHGSLLAISLLLAQSVGPSGVGVYWQAYALLSILELFALGGFGSAMTRFVAVHRAEGDLGGVRGTVRLGLTLTSLTAAAVAVVLAFLAPWLATKVFSDPRLITPLRMVALTLLPLAFQDAALGATKGFKTMKPFALVGMVLEPALRMGLTAALLLVGTGVRGAMAALLASNAIAAVAAAVALRKLMGRPRVEPAYRPRDMFSFSVFSWLAALASTGLIWADTLLLGIFLSSGQVGIYNVATRLVSLASFVMAPITASFGPRIADLYHRRRIETLQRTYAVATSWIVRLSLPAFIALILFAPDLLLLFGRDYAIAASVTIILALGKFVDAATGPCAMMLNMSGRPGLNMVDNIIVLALNFGLNLWLIPEYGIVGSAVAWAIALAVVNFARVAQVRIVLGMLPFGTGTAKGLLAGAGAVGLTQIFRWLIPSDLEFPLGAGVLLIAYVGLIFLFGLTNDDRLLLSSVRSTFASFRRGRSRNVPEEL